MKLGDNAFIIESNRIIREVEIVKCSGGMYMIRFKDSGGGIQVKKYRLFVTKEDEEESLGIKKPESRGFRNLYDYEH